MSSRDARDTELTQLRIDDLSDEREAEPQQKETPFKTYSASRLPVLFRYERYKHVTCRCALKHHLRDERRRRRPGKPSWAWLLFTCGVLIAALVVMAMHIRARSTVTYVASSGIGR